MAKKIKFFLIRFFPGLVFLAFSVVVFKPLWLSNLVPFPGDLLVSWFFPYKEGGWLEYSSWITHKEFVLADVFRQIYPWRILAIDLFKQWSLPFWNIYSFAGTPLLANLQSAVFYPLNILFAFLPDKIAWMLYIFSQPVLASFFFYLFARSLKLSRLSSLISGLGYAYIGYVSVWFELAIVGHTALWLPLALFGLNKFTQIKQKKYLGLTALAIMLAILAGHAQTATYVLLLAFLYLLIMLFPNLDNKARWQSLLALILGIFMASMQILPTFELMLYSSRDLVNSATTFFNFIIPWSHLAMLLVPDYFGNPSTGNFWGKDYGEFMSYSGVIILVFAIVGFWVFHRQKIMRFLIGTFIISLLVAFCEPVARLLYALRLPVLSTGIPSRIVFLMAFTLVLAAGYGVEAVLKLKLKKLLAPLIITIVLYIFLWLLTFLLKISPENLMVTKRNLLLPTGIVFVFVLVIVFMKNFKKFTVLSWLVIILVMSFEYGYFMNKYLPWAKMGYIFPEQQFLIELQKITQYNRVHGSSWAGIGTNLAVQWRVLVAEGYDPLHLRRYSEFVQGITEGHLVKILPRADVMLPDNLYEVNTLSKQRLMNLLGIKYILDSSPIPYTKWDLHEDAFLPNRYELIFQKNRWKIYKNKKALPRAAVFYDYQVEKENTKIIKTLADAEFPYKRRLLLEKEINLSKIDQAIQPAKIVKYSANSVILHGQIKDPGILFLSDNYYPGWKVVVNGVTSELLRADYTFRAVVLPAGEYQVEFKYQPISFYFGVLLSLVSLGGLIFLIKEQKHLDWHGECGRA